MVFSVKHSRDKRDGPVDLTNQRDIYELTANQGARRVRACILAVVPSYVVDEAIGHCDETMKDSYTEPLEARCKKMLAVFNDKFMVSKKMIEDYFGYAVSALSETDYTKLVSIHNSMRDNMSSREDWFEVKKPKEEPKIQSTI